MTRTEEFFNNFSGTADACYAFMDHLNIFDAANPTDTKLFYAQHRKAISESLSSFNYLWSDDSLFEEAIKTLFLNDYGVDITRYDQRNDIIESLYGDDGNIACLSMMTLAALCVYTQYKFIDVDAKNTADMLRVLDCFYSFWGDEGEKQNLELIKNPLTDASALIDFRKIATNISTNKTISSAQKKLGINSLQWVATVLKNHFPIDRDMNHYDSDFLKDYGDEMLSLTEEMVEDHVADKMAQLFSDIASETDPETIPTNVIPLSNNRPKI